MLNTNEFIKKNAILLTALVVGGCVVLLAVNPVACQTGLTAWNNFLSLFDKESGKTLEVGKKTAKGLGDMKKAASGASKEAKADTSKKE